MCPKRQHVFYENKGWLPGQQPGAVAGAGVDLRPGALEARLPARSPDAAGQSGSPSSCRSRGAQVQSGFASWSRTLGRRCTHRRPANWFLRSIGGVATELRGEGIPGMLAHGLFGCLLSLLVSLAGCVGQGERSLFKFF